MAARPIRKQRQSEVRPFGSLIAMLDPSPVIPGAPAAEPAPQLSEWESSLLELMQGIRKADALTEEDFRIRMNVKG